MSAQWMTSGREATKAFGAALVSFGLLLIIWHLGVTLAGTPAHVLPGPGPVLAGLYQGWIGGTLHSHIAFTLKATALGVLIGCGLALVLSVVAAELPIVERTLYPLVVTSQSIPIVAVGPLIIVYAGYGIESKVLLVALFCFFPTFVNSLAGLKIADENLVDLYRAFSASRWQIFWNVKLPGAANYIFSGLQISIVLSLIACVVAEFLASPRGLGHFIKSQAGTLEISMMFAAIITLAVLGTLAGFAVRLLQRLVVFWDRPTSHSQPG